MSSDFRERVERAEDYAFDPSKLGAIPMSGVLRKSSDPGNCVLVLSSGASGDLVLEMAVDDVVEHMVEEGGEPAGDRVTLQVRPGATLSASAKGKAGNSLIPAFLVSSLFAQSTARTIHSVAWREIVTPFSRLDVMLNLLDGLAWTECRAHGKAQCESRFPPGPDRDRCITDRYLECGPRPTLRVDERVLEQLVDLFGGPIRH